ncbi:MAG: archease [Actinobacteria bacterium]|nr:archease [Actinomycetota bacterium]
MEADREISGRFEIIEHLSDTGIKFYGGSPEELFSNAAEAMFSIMGSTKNVRAEKSLNITIDKIAGSLDDLIVLWLERLLYHFEVDGMIFSSFRVSRIEKEAGLFGLSGTALGEAYDPSRHRIEVGIKAPTYHKLKIMESNGLWQGTVIFDI